MGISFQPIIFKNRFLNNILHKKYRTSTNIPEFSPIKAKNPAYIGVRFQLFSISGIDILSNPNLSFLIYFFKLDIFLKYPPLNAISKEQFYLLLLLFLFLYWWFVFKADTMLLHFFLICYFFKYLFRIKKINEFSYMFVIFCELLTSNNFSLR